MENKCYTNKHAYSSKAAAMKVIKSMTRANRLKRKPANTALNAYRCTLCGGFHIGTSTTMKSNA